MFYTQDELSRKDEKEILGELLAPLGPFFYAVIPEARAKVAQAYREDAFIASQNKQNVSRMVNQQARNLWSDLGDPGWVIADKTGYLHLKEESTGARMILRKADPITGGLPKANSTKANVAYFSQSGCLGKGEVKPISYLGQETLVCPNLATINLVAVWRETVGVEGEAGIEVCVCKPKGKGGLGQKNETLFSLTLKDEPLENIRFEPAAELELNLLDNLVDDGTGKEVENEAEEIQKKE